MSNEAEELLTLVKKMGDKLTEDYHIRFCELLDRLGLFEDGSGGPVPLEVWMGVAHALADASGYRVDLLARSASSASGKVRCSICIRKVITSP